MRTIHVIRLQAGQDLKLSIGQFVKEHAIRSGWVVTCGGSVTQYHLRFANQREEQTGEGFFEIINLSGTLSLDGCHLHITLGDGQEF